MDIKKRNLSETKGARNLLAALLIVLPLGGTALAATWDLSLAPFDTPASFTKQVTFSGDSAIKYDFSYPTDAPPARINIRFQETTDGTSTAINWTNVTIVNGANTTSFNIANQPRSICGPDIMPPTPMQGGGALVVEDGTNLRFSVTGMTPAPTFSLIFSGSVVGTGPIKGAYELTIERVLAP